MITCKALCLRSWIPFVHPELHQCLNDPFKMDLHCGGGFLKCVISAGRCLHLMWTIRSQTLPYFPSLLLDPTFQN